MAVKDYRGDRAAAEAVFDHTMAPQAPLYAVIDAARSPEGPHVAQEMGGQCVSLFAGKMGEELGSVAPHLIQFRAKSPFRNWWFEQWGKSIGVLVETPVTMKELRTNSVRHSDCLLR